MIQSQRILGSAQVCVFQLLQSNTDGVQTTARVGRDWSSAASRIGSDRRVKGFKTISESVQVRCC